MYDLLKHRNTPSTLGCCAYNLGTLLSYPQSLPRTTPGSLGGTYATPRVVPPESAILALGRVRRLPRYDAAGHLAPAAVMSVSWGADHRVVDGATLAHCSNKLKALLEHPEQLLLLLR